MILLCQFSSTPGHLCRQETKVGPKLTPAELHVLVISCLNIYLHFLRIATYLPDNLIICQ